jgi:cellulose synthase/poly-beta-1,6-N-acetylglucosamine synthase-like glycosyltransferase
MKVAFWLALAIVAYVYVGYPLVLAVWARVAPRPVRRSVMTPPVSIVVAVRNEAAVIRARVNNLLSLDYPADRRQIIVVSDGSTDDTVEILAGYQADVDVVVLPAGGKALALNAGVARARHDIVVFTDARQAFAPDALRALMAPLADAEVGGVSGELLIDCEAGAGQDTIGDGVGAYWRYEKWLRRHESQIGSIVGSTGAIHALRRELWQPLPAETILDDVLAPMQAVLAGARVVFESSARAYDRVAADAPAEYRRKTRTLAGNYQLLRLQPRLLVPFMNPVWIQFVSHKLGRLIVPFALVMLLVSNAVLAGEHWFYAAALAAQAAFYGLACYGAVLERQGRNAIRTQSATQA